MDWTASLDLVVARTRHERYRALCGADHPDHAAWRARVIALAADAPPPPPPAPPPARNPALAAAHRALRRDRARAAACPYREGCGCALARCYHLGRFVSIADCVACLDAARRPASATEGP